MEIACPHTPQHIKVCKMLGYIIRTERTKKSTETQQILTDEQVEERPHIGINDQSIVNEKMFCKCGILDFLGGY